jgi:hypothetical protein
MRRSLADRLIKIDRRQTLNHAYPGVRNVARIPAFQEAAIEAPVRLDPAVKPPVGNDLFGPASGHSGSSRQRRAPVRYGETSGSVLLTTVAPHTTARKRASV